MFEWTVSLGAAITIGITFIGFGGTLVYNAYMVGRYAASTDARLRELSSRMTDVEDEEKKITDILIEMARSKGEIALLSRRIDDIQQHGSYKLSELIDSLRKQTLVDMKELIERTTSKP